MELRVKDLDEDFKRDFEEIKGLLKIKTNKKALIAIVNLAKRYIYINKDTNHENQRLRAIVRQIAHAEALKTEALQQINEIIYT